MRASRSRQRARAGTHVLRASCFNARVRRDTGLQILVVGAVTALALAANHLFFHWVLFTEALIQRLMF